jgi:hypothetical protein
VIEGSGGTAFSLGSKAFTVERGAVVDLGVLAPQPDWRDGDGPGKALKNMMASALLFGALAKKSDPTPWMVRSRARSSSDMAVPAPLAGSIKAVAYVGGAKFGNYLGGLVNRIDGRAARPQPVALVEPAEQANATN